MKSLKKHLSNFEIPSSPFGWIVAGIVCIFLVIFFIVLIICIQGIFALIPAAIIWFLWTYLGVGKSAFDGMVNDALLEPTFLQVYVLCIVLTIIGSLLFGGRSGS